MWWQPVFLEAIQPDPVLAGGREQGKAEGLGTVECAGLRAWLTLGDLCVPEVLRGLFLSSFPPWSPSLLQDGIGFASPFILS